MFFSGKPSHQWFFFLFPFFQRVKKGMSSYSNPVFFFFLIEDPPTPWVSIGFGSIFPEVSWEAPSTSGSHAVFFVPFATDEHRPTPVRPGGESWRPGARWRHALLKAGSGWFSSIAERSMF